jgi:hypothetical protein
MKIELAPCRSCGRQTKDHYDGCFGLESECALNHTAKEFLMYGVENQEHGQTLCPDYNHVGFDW